MSFRSVHDSVRIRIGRTNNGSLNQFKNQKIILVDPSKSPSELIFFREAFKVIDSKRGTNLKPQYTNLINGYQCGVIPWSRISGFTSGYKAAVNRVCWLLEDLFRTGDLDDPSPITLLSEYAYKVFRFRSNAVDQRGHSNWGHRGACEIWRVAYRQLKGLERSITAFYVKVKPQLENKNVVIKPDATVTTIVVVPAVKPPIQRGIDNSKKVLAETSPISKNSVTEDSDEPVSLKKSIWRKILSCICCAKS